MAKQVTSEKPYGITLSLGSLNKRIEKTQSYLHFKTGARTNKEKACLFLIERGLENIEPELMELQGKTVAA